MTASCNILGVMTSLPYIIMQVAELLATIRYALTYDTMTGARVCVVQGVTQGGCHRGCIRPFCDVIGKGRTCVGLPPCTWLMPHESPLARVAGFYHGSRRFLGARTSTPEAVGSCPDGCPWFLCSLFSVGCPETALVGLSGQHIMHKSMMIRVRSITPTTRVLTCMITLPTAAGTCRQPAASETDTTAEDRGRRSRSATTAAHLHPSCAVHP